MCFCSSIVMTQTQALKKYFNINIRLEDWKCWYYHKINYILEMLIWNYVPPLINWFSLILFLLKVYCQDALGYLIVYPDSNQLGSNSFIKKLIKIQDCVWIKNPCRYSLQVILVNMPTFLYAFLWMDFLKRARTQINPMDLQFKLNSTNTMGGKKT